MNQCSTAFFFVACLLSDKIKDLLKPGSVSSMTRLALVNAIYFKGNWMNRFDEANTKEMPFKINQVGKHGWCLPQRPVCVDIKDMLFFSTSILPCQPPRIKSR